MKVSLPISQSALTPGNQFVVQTPQGPKTIRIVSTTAPTQTVSSATGSQTQSASPVVSREGIKVSGGMLVVDGQVTGIPVSGKTRIIYKGWYQTTSEMILYKQLQEMEIYCHSDNTYIHSLNLTLFYYNNVE